MFGVFIKSHYGGSEQMRRMKIESAIGVVALLAQVGFPAAADATVVIKTFHVAICVTGEKTPDACKKVPADGRVVVSDDAMEWLDGKIGQGATIEAVRERAAAPARGEGHRRRHQDDSQQ
jgi:hypothetical protein